MIARKIDGMAFLAGRWPLDPDRPTLVFIHGSGQVGSFWQAQVDGLTGVANTIAVDLPGHGNSGGDGFRQVSDYSRSVLVLSAAHDTLTPVKYANWMTANIDGACHVTIHGAGHMSPIERPEAVNTAIADFLERLAQCAQPFPQSTRSAL